MPAEGRWGLARRGAGCRDTGIASGCLRTGTGSAGGGCGAGIIAGAASIAAGREGLSFSFCFFRLGTAGDTAGDAAGDGAAAGGGNLTGSGAGGLGWIGAGMGAGSVRGAGTAGGAATGGAEAAAGAAGSFGFSGTLMVSRSRIAEPTSPAWHELVSCSCCYVAWTREAAWQDTDAVQQRWV